MFFATMEGDRQGIITWSNIHGHSKTVLHLASLGQIMKLFVTTVGVNAINRFSQPIFNQNTAGKLLQSLLDRGFYYYFDRFSYI